MKKLNKKKLHRDTIIKKDQALKTDIGYILQCPQCGLVQGSNSSFHNLPDWVSCKGYKLTENEYNSLSELDRSWFAENVHGFLGKK